MTPRSTSSCCSSPPPCLDGCDGGDGGDILSLNAPEISAKKSYVKLYVPEDGLSIEKMLGSGGFSSVYRVRIREEEGNEILKREESFRRSTGSTTAETEVSYTYGSSDPKPPNEEEGGSVLLQDGKPSSTHLSQLKNNNNGPTSGHLSLAMKKLRADTLQLPESARRASKYLALEAAILMKLPYHENIIQLHGVSDNFWGVSSSSSPPTPPVEQRFLLLDLLSETLNDRLCRLRAQQKEEKSKKILVPPWCTTTPRCAVAASKKTKKQLQRQEQLQRVQSIGLPIAQAMEFLHSHRICYRDLKPQNVGFDFYTGRLRLFDFGLARLLDGTEDDGDGDNSEERRRMTGCTGTLRYMAPEVMGCQNYGTTADVYSYALVLHELCTLYKPFPGLTRLHRAKRMILSKKVRPPVGLMKDKSVRELIEASWHYDPRQRPSFALVVHSLKQLSAAAEPPATDE